MKRENYQRVKEIFQAVLDLAPERRAAYLNMVCGGDEVSRREVERLLEAFDSQFLERPAVAQMAEIVVKKKLENEPTEIGYADETSETEEDELPPAPDENALRPSRLRFALVCLLFVNMFIFIGININFVFSIQSSLPFDAAPQGDRVLIVNVRPGFETAFQTGDEIVGVNETNVNSVNFRRLETLGLDRPGERRIITVRGDGLETRQVETVSASPPLSFHLSRILRDVLFPAMFLITGLLLFLLKPNDKQALLMALILGSSLDSGALAALADLPLPLLVVKVFGLLIITLSAPIFLYFCVTFPERSSLLRRFPKLEFLIFTPYLIFVPNRILVILHYAGYWAAANPSLFAFLQSVGLYNFRLYHLAGLLILISTYRQAGEVSRRKLRVGIFGLLCGFLPAGISELVLNPVFRFFEIPNPWHEWMPAIISAPMLLVPPVVAYAIVRHRIIPVSFVIRRGLQYLLAVNALRLLLTLPVLGIVWNIAANPNRTIYEILLNNTLAFYSFIALAVVVGLLMRLRLNEWIDRRFFREQYNQERLLHELIEDVKTTDSMPKLSRLVSDKIQTALHPTSVYLFYRDDRHNSDFSLGYTTGGAESENSANLKLAAESPLLRFMNQARGAIEFPTRQTDDLPTREKRWLRETGANLLVPMHGSDGRLAGIFSLGEKMSQIPYTTRDKKLLETLANQIALVHENLGLKDRVRREQKIKNEVLSRFDEAEINLLKECPKCGKCFDRNNDNCDTDGAELTFTLPVERTIENRYRLEKLIGKGGMGAVYEATDTRINRQVAVKILSGAMFGNKDALRRFEREAQTAGKLNHRNIVTVFDYGVLSTEGAFLVMELVKGETLSEVLKRNRKLDAATVIAWFGQILDGVEAAHKAGIVHRDLKPDNIFVTRNETETVRLCILDFGLARFSEYEFADSVTAPGIIMGTFGYMSPEQLKGEKSDERSDLFAVGVMIYESVRGEKPFIGKTYRELIRSMNKEIFFDSAFAKLLRRSLAYEPKNRFATASEMKKCLKVG